MFDFSENISLPSGWDTKYDFKTGKRYYVNNCIKHTSLDEPIVRYKKLQNGETLSVQTYSSSPARSSPANFFHINQDLNFSSGRPSPVFGRSYSPLMGSGAIRYHSHKVPDATSIDNSIIKIKALFPTVNENHIKILLNKYHYREALVISALQVEKHPLTTPGPYSNPLTAAAKHIAGQFIPSAPGTPSKLISSTIRSLSPKTLRSSPKLKLRYLKNVFPVVEETVLFDTLCNSENNVHKASETLQTMGFAKRDMFTMSPKRLLFKSDVKIKPDNTVTACDQIIIPLHEPSEKPIDEQERILRRLEEKFEKVGRDVILIALESANYNEEKAECILSASFNNSEKKIDSIEKNLTENSPNKECTTNNEDIKGLSNEFGSSTNENISSEFKTDKEVTESIHIVNCNAVHNSGNNIVDKLECVETPSVQNGGFKETVNRLFNNIFKNGKIIYGSRNRAVAKGPNKSLLGQRYIAKGPNPELRVGTNSEYRKETKLKVKRSSLFTTYAAMKTLSSFH